MKKWQVLMTCLAIAVLLVAVGCVRPAPAPAPEEELQKVLHIGAGTGGINQIYGTAMAGLFNKYAGMEASVTAGSGMVHYPLMNSGEVDILPYNLVMPLRAYRGIGVEKTRIRDLSSAGPAAMYSAGIFTLPDPAIKTFKDLRGKKVYAEHTQVPQHASIADALLKVNGMTRTDFTWLAYSKGTEGWRDLKERRVHALFASLGTDSLEASATTGIYLIPYSPKEVEAIVAVEETFVPYAARRGEFGIQVDTPVVGDPTHIIVRAGLNDITAYTIVKTLYEHIGEFHKAHVHATAFTVENALSHMVFPVHPGVIRYYKEIGIWKDEHTQKQKALIEKERKLYGDVADEASFKKLGILR